LLARSGPAVRFEKRTATVHNILAAWPILGFGVACYKR
jgi:hypothetical protein